MRHFAPFAVEVFLDEQTKTRESLAKLTEVLAGIAHTADEKNRERCPYKAVDLHCTYRGGCQNQVRDLTRSRCGGDEFVKFARIPNY